MRLKDHAEKFEVKFDHYATATISVEDIHKAASDLTSMKDKILAVDFDKP